MNDTYFPCDVDDEPRRPTSWVFLQNLHPSFASSSLDWISIFVLLSFFSFPSPSPAPIHSHRTWGCFCSFHITWPPPPPPHLGKRIYPLFISGIGYHGQLHQQQITFSGFPGNPIPRPNKAHFPEKRGTRMRHSGGGGGGGGAFLPYFVLFLLSLFLPQIVLG